MRFLPLHKVFALLMLSLFFFLDTSFAQNTTLFQGEVNADNINIRSDSTSSAQVICTVNRDERLEVTLELYDWYKIRLPKNSPSYVKKGLAECFNFAQDSKTCLNAKILKDSVNVRLKPSESSPIIGKVNKDEVINVLEDTGGWLKIEPVANSSGWIHKKFVQRVSATHSKTETSNKGISVEGIIKPYGKIINRIATHKLVTSDNKVYLLRGNKQSLDSLNYHRVRIEGRLIDAKKEKWPVIEIRILVAVE